MRSGTAEGGIPPAAAPVASLSSPQRTPDRLLNRRPTPCSSSHPPAPRRSAASGRGGCTRCCPDGEAMSILASRTPPTAPRRPAQVRAARTAYPIESAFASVRLRTGLARESLQGLCGSSLRGAASAMSSHGLLDGPGCERSQAPDSYKPSFARRSSRRARHTGASSTDDGDDR